MRSAPPVAVVCEGGVVWAGLLVFLPALAAAAVAAWLAAWGDLPSSSVAAAVLAAASVAGLMGRQGSKLAAAPLCWDGVCWSSGSPVVTGQVEIMMDLGDWLLLRFWPETPPVRTVPAQPVRWLAVSAVAAGGALHGLRVALHGGSPHPAVGHRSAEQQPG